MTAQLEIAWDAAEQGIRQSAEHAEAVESGWGEAALCALRAYADMSDAFSSEDFRDYLKSIGFSCPVPKGLGACFVKAVRQGWLEKAGTTKSRERHGSVTWLWRLNRVARAA